MLMVLYRSFSLFLIAFENYSPDFPLLYLKVLSVLIGSVPVKLLQWGWVFCCVVVVKVFRIYVWLTVWWSIGVVLNSQVRLITKPRAITFMITNGICCLIRLKLVLVRYGKNKRLPCWQVWITWNGNPNQRVVASNFLSKFSHTNS